VNQRAIAGNLFRFKLGQGTRNSFASAQRRHYLGSTRPQGASDTADGSHQSHCQAGRAAPRIREHDAWRSAKPFDSKWLLKIKYNGVRVLAIREGEDTRLCARGGTNITSRYSQVVLALNSIALDRSSRWQDCARDCRRCQCFSRT
jgi:hypothetical protein